MSFMERTESNDAPPLNDSLRMEGGERHGKVQAYKCACVQIAIQRRTAHDVHISVSLGVTG